MAALGTESCLINNENKHGPTAMLGTIPGRGSKRQGGCTRRRLLVLSPKLLRQNIRLKTQNPKPGAQ